MLSNLLIKNRRARLYAIIFGIVTKLYQENDAINEARSKWKIQIEFCEATNVI